MIWLSIASYIFVGILSVLVVAIFDRTPIPTGPKQEQAALLSVMLVVFLWPLVAVVGAFILFLSKVRDLHNWFIRYMDDLGL